MNYIGIENETFVDGEGVRFSIYVAGCENKCKGCHNPGSWDFSAGEELTTEKMLQIADEFEKNTLLDGFTILGGEPLHPKNRDAMIELLFILRQVTNSIWLYTGYRLEDLIREKDERLETILYNVDILVDGPFVEALKTKEPFIGSSNQRLIRTRDMIREERFRGVYVNVFKIS